jgi:hypothetical protein
VYPFGDRDWTGVGHLVLGLLLCGGALALLLTSLGGTSPPSAEQSAAPPPPARPAARVEIRREPAGRPFTVAGASFTVLPHPGAAWAAAARAGGIGGSRLEVLAVEVVNRTRTGFNPALLSYLLRGRGNALYAPERGGTVGPNGLGLASGLPRGARAEERLVFAVPVGLRHPVLAIQPSPVRPLELRIQLGSRQPQ